MKDRILKFLNKEGVSPTKFADEIGVQRSSVSHILAGRNNPSFDFIQKILSRYKNLNSDWLILGNGEMFKKIEKNITILPDIKTIIENPIQKDLFSGDSINVDDLTKSKLFAEHSEPNKNKQVEKIIILYTDKTFIEYTPSI